MQLHVDRIDIAWDSPPTSTTQLNGGALTNTAIFVVLYREASVGPQVTHEKHSNIRCFLFFLCKLANYGRFGRERAQKLHLLIWFLLAAAHIIVAN
jgi:hypothetical protein